jgi:phosphotransferase system  glucose/maltose/N-acetylglucosamine-specific IIC component
MKLSIKALTLAGAILWGAAVFLIGIAHLIWPSYGTAMLEAAASIYPGYTVGGFGSVIVGTVYALLDGAIAGAVFAWLYNRFAPSPPAVA